MTDYVLSDYWASLLRDFKDSEKEFGNAPFDTEEVGRFILDYATNTKFRQYNMFTQQRGEEFEKMMEIIESKGMNVETAKRMMYDEEFWRVTLELANS